MSQMKINFPVKEGKALLHWSNVVYAYIAPAAATTLVRLHLSVTWPRG